MKRVWLTATAMGAVFAACALIPASAQDASEVEIIRGDALQEAATPPPRIVRVAPAHTTAPTPLQRLLRRASVQGDIKPESGGEALIGGSDAQARGTSPASAASASASSPAAAMAPESDAMAAPASMAEAATPIAAVAATEAAAAAPHTRALRAGDINSIVLSALSCSTAVCGASDASFPGAALTAQASGGTLDQQRIATMFQNMMAPVWTEQQQRAIAMIGYYSAAATLCEGSELDADAVSHVVQANFSLAPGATDDQLRRRRDALSMHIGMAAGIAMGAHIDGVFAFCTEAASNRHNFATPLLHQIADTEPETEPKPGLEPLGPPPLSTPLASR